VTTAQPTDERRKAVVAPQKVNKNMTLFEYLANCQPPIDKKIIDIAMAQTQVPRELREDAGQEIRLVWSTLKPDIQRFKPGQIASYAHRIATHAALRLRRELGSSVRLPGSAFRKRKDGSSYVTPGVLSVALDWNELESWFDASDNVEAGELTQTLEPSLLLNLDGMTEDADEGGQMVDEEEEQRRARLESLERHAKRLSRRQYTVLARLIAGESFEDIQTRIGHKKGVVLREIAIGASLIGNDLAAAVRRSAAV
jgi:DNA-directed RNA polymerase specialized sigma24 family protein